MIQLTYCTFSGMLFFETPERSVEVELKGDGNSMKDDDWKNEGFVKSVATVLTGKDHTKLRESIEVVDQKGLRLYYLEKL